MCLSLFLIKACINQKHRPLSQWVDSIIKCSSNLGSNSRQDKKFAIVSVEDLFVQINYDTLCAILCHLHRSM